MRDSSNAVTATPAIRPRNRFFVSIAVAMLVVVSLGFGRSFYLRPLTDAAPLPPYLVVHGVVMTAWYLLFLVQVLLVQTGRRDLHRRFGIAGMLLAAGVVISGAQAHLGLLPRLQARGPVDPEQIGMLLGFVIAGLASLVPIVVLIVLAVGMRRRPQVHKRLMYWVVVWTLGPAFSNTRPLGKWLDPLVAPYLPYFPSDLLWLAALVAFDLVTLRKVHPATWSGFALLAAYLFVVMEWCAAHPALRVALAAHLGVVA